MGFEIMNSSNYLTPSTKNEFHGIIINNEIKRIIAKVGTSVAILLLTYTVLTTKLFFGSFGLIHSLPFTFFIAMCLLVVSSVILWNDPERSTPILTIQLITFLAGLWLIPFLIELVPSRTSYTCAGFVEYIVQYGTLNPDVAFYHNWPAHSILCATLANVLGITDLTKLMGLTPFFSNCFYFLSLCLLRPFIYKQGLITAWWPMVWVFFIANYLGQDYFCPQGMAYFFFLLFVGLLLLSWERDSYASKSSGNIMKLLLFCSMTAAHPLTPIVACVTVFILNFRRQKWFSSLFMPIIVILVAWTLYGASVYFNGHIGGFLHEAFNLGMSFDQNIVRVGTTGDGQVDKVSLFYTLILVMLSLLGWLTTKPGLLKDVFTRLFIVPLFLPFFVSYGGEMIVRVLLFSLLSIAFFSSSFLRKRKALATYAFILFLMFSIPLHIISHYGNEEYNYVSQAERDTANFIFGNIIDRYEIVTENDPIFRQNNLERFAVILTSTSYFKDGKIVGHWSRSQNDTQYAVISRGTWVAYNRFKGDKDMDKLKSLDIFLKTSTSYGCIYANGESMMYIFNEV